MSHLFEKYHYQRSETSSKLNNTERIQLHINKTLLASIFKIAKKRKLSNEELQTKESETKINLKLLVDSSKNKVLFAEAGKDFVDFIFHIMSLPLGTIVKLLNQNNMVGCLGDLYKSVKSLNTQYFESDHSKKSVLKPVTAVKVPLLSLNNEASAVKFYRCGSGNCTCHSITYIEGTLCPNCHKGMNKEVRFVEPTASEAKPQPQPSSSNEGYVKGVVTYMVMDNLEVQPMSTISGITMMNKFGIKDVASLVEMNVRVGLKEGKAILKASLETKSVLTSVFIGKKI